MRRFGDSFLDIEFSPYKFIEHIDKLRLLAKGGDVFPVTVELDPVDYCKHNCWWCVDPRHGKCTQNTGFVTRLLQELRALGIQAIVFKGGGEPTLHRAFPEIIEKAGKAGFEVGIVTNGSRLKEIFEPVVLNASYIRISLDGPTRESHMFIHGVDQFQQIVEGIERTVSFRNSMGRRHPVIGLSFAMDYRMIELVQEAARLGAKLNVDYVLFRPPFFEEVGRTPSMTTAEKQKLLARFEEVKKNGPGGINILIDYWISDNDQKSILSWGQSPRRGIFMNADVNGIEHITGRCLAAPLMAVITADKTVYPCCNLRFLNEWSLGRIDYADDISFEKIWKSKRRKQIMQRIHSVECIDHCTHPLSKYNEIIEYLKSPRFHKGFI